MSLIKLTHVDFHYDAPYNEVFADLNLSMDTTWRTGLVGRNGMGKSTLLNLLNGRYQPQVGSIECTVPLVYFPTAVDESLLTRDALKDALGPYRAWETTMAKLLSEGSERSLVEYGKLQERYEAADGYLIDAALATECHAMALDDALLDQPFASLSGGEQTRVLVAALFANKRAFPLIDEPTNHLDASGRQLLAAYLANQSGFILVSHDRHFLNDATDHIVAINKNDVEVIHGNYAAWKTHTDNLEQHEQRTRANIEREVKQLKKAALARRQGADSREADKLGDPRVKNSKAYDKGYIGHSAAKQMKRALNVEGRIDRQLQQKSELLKNQEKQRSLVVTTRESAREEFCRVQDVSVVLGGRTVLDKVTLEINQGERIAVTGANGSGKSTLLNVIAGDIEPAEGIVVRPGHVTFSRAYQIPIWQSGELRPRLRDLGLDETRFRQILGSFGVSGDVFDRPLETFSQGQRKKVDLARAMMADVDFMIWDEPMNYVDVLSREQIEQAIIASEPTILFVEHDVAFIDNVATRVFGLDA